MTWYTKAQADHDEKMRRNAAEARPLIRDDQMTVDAARSDAIANDQDDSAYAWTPDCMYCGGPCERPENHVDADFGQGEEA